MSDASYPPAQLPYLNLTHPDILYLSFPPSLFISPPSPLLISLRLGFLSYLLSLGPVLEKFTLSVQRTVPSFLSIFSSLFIKQ
jgi:hypothetical protein